MTKDSTSVCQVVGVVYSMYSTSRKRFCETHCWKTQRGTVLSITNTYSLEGLKEKIIFILVRRTERKIIFILVRRTERKNNFDFSEKD